MINQTINHIMKKAIIIISAIFTLSSYTYSQNNSIIQTKNDSTELKINSKSQSFDDDAWNIFIKMINDANCEFAKGVIGESTKAVWSHGDDVTLFGGYGSLIEPGWKNVEARLESASKQFVGGTYSSKEISKTINGDFAYLLQTEQYIFPGKPAITFRVTIICRREPDGWKIVHRHGDMMKEL